MMPNHILLFFGCVFLCGCAETDLPPTTEERLQGAWVRTWTPYGATTNYSFDGHGQCITYAILPAQPVQIYVYAYGFEGDTLTMTDLATSSPFQVEKRAVVEFSEDGDTVNLGWIGGVKYVLTRL